MAYTQTDLFYLIIDGEIGGRSTTQYAENDSDAFRASNGDYRLWEDKSAANPYGQYAQLIADPLVVDEVGEGEGPRVTQLWSWIDPGSEEKRERIATDIDIQVSQPSTKDLISDAGVEADVIREESAAEDKRIELQGTADGDLDAFDPTIQVAPKQNGVEYSRLIVEILEQDPWPGQETKIYGPVASLEVQSGYEDQGADARMNVYAP